MLAAAGRAYADIVIYNADESAILSTVSFILNIMSAPDIAENATSSDEFLYLQQVTSNAQEVISSAQAWAMGPTYKTYSLTFGTSTAASNWKAGDKIYLLNQEIVLTSEDAEGIVSPQSAATQVYNAIQAYRMSSEIQPWARGKYSTTDVDERQDYCYSVNAYDFSNIRNNSALSFILNYNEYTGVGFKFAPYDVTASTELTAYDEGSVVTPTLDLQHSYRFNIFSADGSAITYDMISSRGFRYMLQPYAIEQSAATLTFTENRLGLGEPTLRLDLTSESGGIINISSDDDAPSTTNNSMYYAQAAKDVYDNLANIQASAVVGSAGYPPSASFDATIPSFSFVISAPSFSPSIGVTTGSAGTNASVSMSGMGTIDSPYTFSMVIPRGDKGDTGGGNVSSVDGIEPANDTKNVVLNAVRYINDQGLGDAQQSAARANIGLSVFNIDSSSASSYTGQVLSYNSSGAVWRSINEVPANGTLGEVLTKTENSYVWSSINAVPSLTSQTTPLQVLITNSSNGYEWGEIPGLTDQEIDTILSS